MPKHYDCIAVGLRPWGDHQLTVPLSKGPPCSLDSEYSGIHQSLLSLTLGKTFGGYNHTNVFGACACGNREQDAVFSTRMILSISWSCSIICPLRTNLLAIEKWKDVQQAPLLAQWRLNGLEKAKHWGIEISYVDIDNNDLSADLNCTIQLAVKDPTILLQYPATG